MNKLRIIDVGAAGGIDKKWNDFPIEAHLFEPDERSNMPEHFHTYRIALSNAKKEVPLYLYKEKHLSSVYEPNWDVLDILDGPEWVDRDEWLKGFEVVNKEIMKADTLDNVFKEEADFLKVDVQGYELPVLQGAVETLKKVIGVEVEVEFIPYYKGQATFGEVDKFLRDQGFELWKFGKITTWSNRVIWTDALYLRRDIPEEKRDQKFAILLAHNYFQEARKMNVDNDLVDRLQKRFNLEKWKQKISFYLRKFI